MADEVVVGPKPVPKLKKVGVVGVNQEVDYGKEDAGFAAEAKEKAGYLKGIEGQVAAKKATQLQFGDQITANAGMQAAAERALRRKSAQAMAGVQARGAGGGGAIIALGNQAAVERGVGEGQLKSEFGKQRADLQTQQARLGEEVAAAETEASAERRKMLDVERAYAVKANDIKQKVREWIAESGAIFSTDNDKRQALARADRELLGQLPPELRAKITAELEAEFASSTTDTDWLWDI